jgi:hypothetical protein
MALSNEERQEVIETTVAYLSLQERGELVQEQQGGLIHSLSEPMANRLAEVQHTMRALLERVQHDGKMAIRCRGVTFAFKYDAKGRVCGMAVIPEDRVEVIDG